jgi:hypothetical protein
MSDGGHSAGGTEHHMTMESLEVVRKDISLKNRSLVGENREVLEKQMSEYVCSCGERFDVGRDARDHLLSLQPDSDQEGDDD